MKLPPQSDTATPEPREWWLYDCQAYSTLHDAMWWHGYMDGKHKERREVIHVREVLPARPLGDVQPQPDLSRWVRHHPWCRLNLTKAEIDYLVPSQLHCTCGLDEAKSPGKREEGVTAERESKPTSARIMERVRKMAKHIDSDLEGKPPHVQLLWLYRRELGQARREDEWQHCNEVINDLEAAWPAPAAPVTGVSAEAMEWFRRESAWYDRALIEHVPGSLNDQVQGYYHEILAALSAPPPRTETESQPSV